MAQGLIERLSRRDISGLKDEKGAGSEDNNALYDLLGEGIMGGENDLYSAAGQALREAETKIYESERKFRAVFDASPDMICVVDRDGGVIEANRAMRQRFMPEGSGTVRTVFDFLSVEEPAVVALLIEDIFKGGEFNNRYAEVTARGGGGEELLVGVNAAPLEDGTDRALFICRDVTARKRGEEMLRTALVESFKSRREVAALQKSTRIILEEDDVKRGALEVLNICKELIGVSKGNIFLFSDEGLTLDELDKSYKSLWAIEFSGYAPQLEELIDRAFSEQAPAFINTPVQSSNQGLSELQNALVAPISLDGVRFAVLLLAGMPGGFSGGDAETVAAFCGILATAFAKENALGVLRESEGRFRALFESSPVGIAIARRRKLMFVNKTYLDMFGYKDAEEVIGTSLLESMGPSVRNEIEEMNKRREAGECVIPGYETEGRKKNGESFPIYLVASTVGINGKPATVAFFNDISELKKKEEELRMSEVRFRRIAENAPDIILRWSPEAGVEYINPIVEDTLGYTPDELLGDRSLIFMRIHPDDVKKYTAAVVMAETNLTPSAVEIRLKTKLGEYKWLEAKIIPIQDDIGGINAIECMLRDVTERKSIELETTRNHEFQGALNGLLHLSSSPVPFNDKLEAFLDLLIGTPWLCIEKKGAIFTVEPKGAKELLLKASVNMAATHLKLCASVPFGYCLCGKAASEKQLIFTDKIDGRHDVLFDDMPGHGHYCVPVLQGDETLGVITLYLKENSEDSEICRKFLESSAEVLSGMIQKHRMEEEKDGLYAQLLQSQKMEAIGTLTGGIAHDYNNMLAVIMGNTQLMLMGMRPDSPGYAELKEIELASTRTRDLTMKLLTFARKEKIHLSAVPINSIIPDIVKMFERASVGKTSIETFPGEGMRGVNIDVNQIQQALLNILNNSRDAMPDEGVITIRTYETTLPEGLPRSGPDITPGDYCAVEIADQGTGIPKDYISKVFEPFFTTKEVGKGTGLGLSTAFGIVVNHGGYMDIDSEEGKGTVITIYLPVFAGGAAPAGQAPKETIINGGLETILVVDDEESVLNVSAKMLKSAGYRILTAADGKSAVETYREHRDEIALVLMDMLMPGMDGREAFRQIRAINPDAKAVLASGYSLDGPQGEITSSEFQGFVQKPFTVADLSKAVRQAIGGE